jgi:hypothetical protein
VDKYSKKGQAFRIRNPADDGSPQVIIPKKYLDEVKNASEARLSFPLHSIQVRLLMQLRFDNKLMFKIVGFPPEV